MNTIEQEFTGCEWGDKRLNKRLVQLGERLYSKIGERIPTACGTGAETKAAYRFLNNDEIAESPIVAGHYKATGQRFHKSKGAVLVLHDTTEFTYHAKANAIGKIRKVYAKKGTRDTIHCDGRLKRFTKF